MADLIDGVQDYPGVDLPDERDVMAHRQGNGNPFEIDPQEVAKQREEWKAENARALRAAALETAQRQLPTASLTELLVAAKALEDYMNSGTLPPDAQAARGSQAGR